MDLDADPDSDFNLFEADPDPDPSFQIKAQTITHCSIYKIFRSVSGYPRLRMPHFALTLEKSYFKLFTCKTYEISEFCSG